MQSVTLAWMLAVASSCGSQQATTARVPQQSVTFRTVWRGAIVRFGATIVRTPEAWSRVVIGRLGEGSGEAARREELLALPLDFGRNHVFACSIEGDPGLVPELESVTVSGGELVFALGLRGRATAVGMIATHAFVVEFDARAASAARVTRALVRGDATTELPVSRED